MLLEGVAFQLNFARFGRRGGSPKQRPNIWMKNAIFQFLVSLFFFFDPVVGKCFPFNIVFFENRDAVSTNSVNIPMGICVFLKSLKIRKFENLDIS